MNITATIGFNKSQVARMRRAFEMSPRTFKTETNKYLVRVNALLLKRIWTDPWRMKHGKALKPGGVPVSPPPTGGTLRTSHQTRWQDLGFEIVPNTNYMYAVHEGRRGVTEPRPWLTFAVEDTEKKVDRLGRELLQTLTNSLAA